MRTAAVLPVKRFAAAKTRLGASVADDLRLALARAMVADVIGALAECREVELTILVTGQDDLAHDARASGAVLIEDRSDRGQSAAVSRGIARAVADGFERVLCVPGDCPALDAAEVGALLSSSTADVVIVPDRHGSGTNALLLSPPDAIAPSFGPDSCARHRASAIAANLSWSLEQVSSLLLDVDTGADLEALRERLAGTTAPAPRTRALLGRGADPSAALTRARTG